MRALLLIILAVIYAISVKMEGFRAYVREPQSIVETRLKIVVIDAGMSKEQVKDKAICKDIKNVAKMVKPTSWTFHGINVIGLIAERINTEKYCIYPIYWDLQADDDNGYLKSLKEVSELGKSVVAVNMSLSGTKNIASEYGQLKKWTLDGIQVHVAAGNNFAHVTSKEECIYFPACYRQTLRKNFTVVISTTGTYSNTYMIFDTVATDGTSKGTPQASGTSQATAIYTGLRYSK